MASHFTTYDYGKIVCSPKEKMELELKLRDDKIKELQRQLADKEEVIKELKSKLDKFQSVLPAAAKALTAQPRKQRAHGIAAESLSVTEVTNVQLRKHSKTLK